MGNELQDNEIVQLLWDRQEEGIAQLQAKYKRYCGAIAKRIVVNPEDTEECVNDTWLRAWNSIPPHRPENLAGYLAKIVRNLALNTYKKQHRKKRGGDVVTVALEELSDCLADKKDTLEEIERQELSDMIANYLRGKSIEQQAIFIKRYFYLMEIKELAGDLQIKENTVKSILVRIMKEIKRYLEGERGFI